MSYHEIYVDIVVKQTITMFSASFIPTYMKKLCQKGLLPGRELEPQMEFLS